MYLDDNIADIGKPYGICSLTFVVDDFSVLFSYPLIFSNRDSRST